MTRVGGVTPDDYGLSLTVTVPTASADNPIRQGDTLRFAATGPYHAAPTADGEEIQLVAKHPVYDPLSPLGVHVYGFSRVDRYRYTGTAPAIGASIVAAGKNSVREAAAGTGTGYVLFVDTARGMVEVAMP